MKGWFSVLDEVFRSLDGVCLFLDGDGIVARREECEATPGWA